MMDHISNETLLEYLKRGQIDLFNTSRPSKISFFGEDLSNLQLQNVDLSNCNLKKCDFSHSVLSHANLSQSTCNGADFSNCNLSEISIHNTSFHEAFFENTQITNSFFDNCYFEESEFFNVSFTNCNLEACSLKKSTFHSCNFDLAHANLSKFSWSIIQNCTFVQTQFQECKFPHAKFIESSIKQASMTDCTLVYTDLSTSHIQDTFFTNSNLYSSEWGNVEILRCDFSQCDISELQGKPKQFIDCTFSLTQGGYLFDRTPLPQLKFATPIQPNLVYGKDHLLLYWIGEEFWYTMIYDVTKNNESQPYTFPIPKERILYNRPIPIKTGWDWICVEKRKSNNFLVWFHQDINGQFELIQEHKIPVQLQPHSIQQTMKAYPVKGGFLLYCIQIQLLAIHWKRDRLIDGTIQKYCKVHHLGFPTSDQILGRGKPILLSKGGGLTPIDLLQSDDSFELPPEFETSNFQVERQGKHIVLAWCTYQEDEQGNKTQQKGIHVYNNLNNSHQILHPNDIILQYAIALSKGNTWLITQVQGRKIDHSPLEDLMGMDLPSDMPPDVLNDIFAEFEDDFRDIQPKMGSITTQPEIHIHNLHEENAIVLFGDLGIYGDEIDHFVPSNKGTVLFVNIEGGFVIFDLYSEEPQILWERE